MGVYRYVFPAFNKLSKLGESIKGTPSTNIGTFQLFEIKTKKIQDKTN